MLQPNSDQHILATTTLALLCVLAALPQLTLAQDVSQYCQNGPDDLVPFGAEQTCIESPEFEGERCFYTLIPDCAGEDSPLVYDIHGADLCPFVSALYSGWREKAAEHCFVLVYPIGQMGPTAVDFNCWGIPGGLENDNGTASVSCCCAENSTPVVVPDEGPFLRQIAAVLSRDVPIQTSGNVTIDTKRIYMAGHSNGCIASFYMAAQYSDMVAAVGCHAGTATAPFVESYSPRPIAMVHGTIDATLSYNRTSSSVGDAENVTDGYDVSTLDLFSALETYDIFSEINGCSTFNETALSNGDNYTVTKFSSLSCTDNASVVMYAMENVGHFPFPAEAFAYLNGPGSAPVVVDTTKWMWDFVKQYSLEEAPDLVVEESSDTPTPSTVATPTPTADNASSSAPTRATAATPTPTADNASSSPRPSQSYFHMVIAMILVSLAANSGICMRL
eukprot:scaffold1147_cov126-Cylindrotheca_fusiformis.AAC.3